VISACQSLGSVMNVVNLSFVSDTWIELTVDPWSGGASGLGTVEHLGSAA